MGVHRALEEWPRDGPELEGDLGVAHSKVAFVHTRATDRFVDDRQRGLADLPEAAADDPQDLKHPVVRKPGLAPHVPELAEGLDVRLPEHRLLWVGVREAERPPHREDEGEIEPAQAGELGRSDAHVVRERALDREKRQPAVPHRPPQLPEGCALVEETFEELDPRRPGGRQDRPGVPLGRSSPLRSSAGLPSRCRQADVQMIVVAGNNLHHPGRATQPRRRAHEDPLGAGRHKPVDEVLGQAEVNLLDG